MVVYGTAIWEETYREDPRTIKEIIDVDEETGEVQYELVEIKEYQDVYGAAVNIWNFYIDEDGTDFETAKDCIKREVLTLDEFKRIYSRYKNAEKVQAGGETDPKETDPKPEGDNKDEVEVLHYYNRPHDIYWIVANEVLVNDFGNPIPYKHKELPFSHGVLIKRLGHFYGLGFPKIIEGVQAELDTVRRMGIDRAKLHLSRPFLAASRAQLRQRDVEISPGKLIQVPNPRESLMGLEFSDTGSSRYREEELLKDDSRQATGIANPAQSVITGATATESALFKNQPLKDLDISLFKTKSGYLKELADLELKIFSSSISRKKKFTELLKLVD
ncbi:MAG: hypothetical protein DDT42_02107 [candidate division WS2 bacterium]|uniref:Uncharacterized protein n=1 Tax=Psychracetigena formicireducens TaxID=2986056 RepID=A0A9E2BII3_PSYF1|nr:hypothetical protein [Candidatus Psychracetigena formicireducens]